MSRFGYWADYLYAPNFLKNIPLNTGKEIFNWKEATSAFNLQYFNI